MRAGLTPNAVQWCRCGGLRGPNLAECVAVRRRFRAKVGVFWQSLVTQETGIILPSCGLGGTNLFAPVPFEALRPVEINAVEIGHRILHLAADERDAENPELGSCAPRARQARIVPCPLAQGSVTKPHGGPPRRATWRAQSSTRWTAMPWGCGRTCKNRKN